MDRKITAAVGVLSGLKMGDPVDVTADGRTYRMAISRPLHRCDGAFGSYESSRVTVTLGVGRWATEVTAEGVASGRQGIERVTR